VNQGLGFALINLWFSAHLCVVDTNKHVTVESGKHYSLLCDHNLTKPFEIEWRIENSTVVAGRRVGQIPSYGPGYSFKKVSMSFPEGDLTLKSVSCDDDGIQYKCMSRSSPSEKYQQGDVYTIQVGGG